MQSRGISFYCPCRPCSPTQLLSIPCNNTFRVEVILLRAATQTTQASCLHPKLLLLVDYYLLPVVPEEEANSGSEYVVARCPVLLKGSENVCKAPLCSALQEQTWHRQLQQGVLQQTFLAHPPGLQKCVNMMEIRMT